MLINKIAFQSSNKCSNLAGSGASYLSWIHRVRFYAILTIAFIFTSCDSSVVDSGTSPSSADFVEMHQNGDNDVAPVCEAALLDVSLVIDVSGSMFGDRLQAAKNGAKTLVDELGDSDQGALVSFSTQAQRNLDLTIMDAAGQTTLNAAIDGLTATNLTNIQGGIIYGAEELTGDESLYNFVDTNPSGNNRVDATKIMVLLSDGVANRYYNNAGTVVSGPANVQNVTNTAATNAKNAGIRIFTIAIGNANVAAMSGYASSPDDAYTSADLADLTTVFSQIAEAICPTAVDIDIKPGSYPNSINPNQKGNIPVAVFTTDDFDASTIDPETVRFGSLATILSGNGATVAHMGGHLEDVNGDGRPDFVGHFATQDTGFTTDDEYGWIVGETYGGESFAGFDEVRILGKPSP